MADHDPHAEALETDRIAHGLASEEARILARLSKVAVPENLDERIKARLRTALLVDPCLESASACQSNDSLKVAPERLVAEKVAAENYLETEGTNVGKTTGFVRRAVLVLAMAAALAGIAFLTNQWRQPSEREWLVAQCHIVLDRWEQDNPANLATNGNWGDVPVAVREQLARVTLRGTRSIAELTNKFKGTLYRLDTADGHSLLLVRLVDLPTVRGLNSRFAALHTPSGGWSLAALQVNNETYVLAADCTEQQLMNYIRLPVVT